MVLDSIRTVVIWLVDLALGNGTFKPLTLIGFSFMCAHSNPNPEPAPKPALAFPPSGHCTGRCLPARSI